MREFINNSREFNIALQMLLHIPVVVNYIIQTNYKGNNDFLREFKEVAKIYWKNGDTSKVDTTKLKDIFDVMSGIKCERSFEYFSTFIDILSQSGVPYNEWVTGRIYIERSWPDGRDSDTQSFTCCRIDENDEPVPDDMNTMLDRQFGWQQYKEFIDPISKEVIYNGANHRTTLTLCPKVLIYNFIRGHKKKVPNELLMNGYSANLVAACTDKNAIVRQKDQWYVNSEKSDYNDTDEFTALVYILKNQSS